MSELVKDPTYRKFLETKPKTPRVTRDPKKAPSPPWVVYVQQEMGGSWGKKEFWKYPEAFRFFKAWLNRGAYDATINNKRYPTRPPSRLVRIKGKFVLGSDGKNRQATKYVSWKPSLAPEDPIHHWCLYCRRPTVFKYFTKHKRLGVVDATVRRCCICGASERIAMIETERKVG